MQTLEIMSVYDTAISSYMRPFASQSIGAAVRQFEDEYNTPDTPIAKHPEDYALFHLGTFDDSSGNIETIEPRCVRRAHEIQRPGQD